MRRGCVAQRHQGGARDPLRNSSRVRVGRIGMGCKADFAANSTAIGKKFNAADRPCPGYHGPRGVMQRVPWALGGHGGQPRSYAPVPRRLARTATEIFQGVVQYHMLLNT